MDPPSSADANKSHGAALKLLGLKVLRIDELETENASLQAQLEALRRGPNETPSAAPAEECVALQKERDELAKSYRELERHHAKCKTYIELVEKKYQKTKDRLLEWKAWYDRKVAQKTVTAPDSKVAGSIRSISDVAPGGTGADLDREKTPRPVRPAPEEVLDHDTDITPLPTRLAGYHKAEVKDPGLTRSRSMRVSSSQTTEAGSDPAGLHSSPLGKHEPSSDGEPIVVSSRTLKRKRSDSTQAMPPPVRIKQEQTSPEKPIEIRSEDYSSPVLVRQHVLRQETSDLDAFTEIYNTPRKHRARRRAVSEEFTRPPALATRVSSLLEGDVPEPDEDIDSLKSESGLEPGIRIEAPVPISDLRQEYASSRGTDDALRPLSVNIPAKRRAEPHRSTKQRRRSDEDAAVKVAMLSEDGEADAPVAKQPKVASAEDKATPKAQASRRLDTMLDDPSADTRRLIRDHTPQSAVPKSKRPLTPVSDPRPTSRRSNVASPSRHGHLATNTTPKPKPLSKKASPEKRGEHRFRRPLGVEDSPPPVRPDDEPLRLRSLASLRLEDFKVNPKFMGADFAFVDTLRGRDQRRCLQGCTKPECCGGAFLQAVEMAGTSGSAKSDAEVLEAYLGPNWQQMVGACPRDKRDGMLKQARMASFANQFGKHRHAFERHSTPPGFWRTDMPTTQEEAADRVKANEMVRQKVEERWREAMRDGDGRWLFRDE
ncbi:hypothetical protein LTR85_006622 [Meristemomyces frigidus]|nr:hypothetical protein LTR85_006622 [Meristemomyces frigidus]